MLLTNRRTSVEVEYGLKATSETVTQIVTAVFLVSCFLLSDMFLIWFRTYVA